MPYFKVSLTNVIIEADNDENARLGFANYVSTDCGIENFEVEQTKLEDGQDADYTENSQ